ncbi:hypothetical protein HispidOSU_011417, partial [Sigmodon hispidus]
TPLEEATEVFIFQKLNLNKSGVGEDRVSEHRCECRLGSVKTTVSEESVSKDS